MIRTSSLLSMFLLTSVMVASVGCQPSEPISEDKPGKPSVTTTTQAPGKAQEKTTVSTPIPAKDAPVFAATTPMPPLESTQAAMKAALTPLVLAKKMTLPKPSATLALPFGVIVGFPVPSESVTEEERDFADACGLYMTLAVAGNRAYGRTPSLYTAGRVAGKTRLLASASDVPTLLGRSGATHAAVGTITGTGNTLKLSYQWYKAESGKAVPVGKEVAITGTQEQIVAKLPQIAQTLQQSLGSPVPSPLALPADKMVLIGNLHRTDSWSDAQNEQANQLPFNPFSAFFLCGVAYGLPENQVETQTELLLKALPENSLVWSHLAVRRPDLLMSRLPELDKKAKTSKSYLLYQSLRWLHHYQSQTDAEMRAGESALLCAPGNPDAYLSLAKIKSDAAQAVRLGKYFDQIPAQQMGFLTRTYEEREALAQKATTFDPQYGKAWLELSEAAAFASDRQTALAAFDKAVHLEPYNENVLYWGLQLFQPKWFGDSGRLPGLAKAVVEVSKSGLSPGMVTSFSQVLSYLQMPGEAKELLANTLAVADARIAATPTDTDAHYLRAITLAEQGNVKEAIASYQQNVKLLPNSSQAHYNLGDYLSQKVLNTQAIPELQEAIRLNPRHYEAYMMLAYALKNKGQRDEAEQVIKKALVINPRFGRGYNLLGAIYIGKKQYKDAQIAYEKAVTYRPDLEEAYQNLGGIYIRNKDWKKSIAAYEAVLIRRPESLIALEGLCGVYPETKEFAKGEAVCRELVRRNDNDALAHNNLGLNLNGLGKTAEARKHWERTIELGGNPDAVKESQEMLAKYPAIP